MFPKRIVAFGSSSVHGKLDYESGGFVQRLRLWHEPKDPRHVVYNLGLNGDTSDGMLRRFSAECSARSPHLIIFYPGLNDTCRMGEEIAKREIDPDKYKANLEGIYRRAKDIAPILFITAFPLDESKTLPWNNTERYYTLKDAIQYTQTAKEVCEASGGLCLDILEKWKDRDRSEFLSEDGLHASSKGHEMLFEELKSFLEDKFK